MAFLGQEKRDSSASQEETTVLAIGDGRTSFKSNGHGMNDGAHGRPDLFGQFDLARVWIARD
jgi:hypothetical protein